MITRRSTSRPVQVRADGDQKRIEGYAIVFYDEANADGTQYELWPGTFERVMPGCVIRTNDLMGFWNHDMSKILGRESAQTLEFNIDSVGLRYSILVGNSTHALDALDCVQRGDVRGSSFGFRTIKEAWANKDDGGEIRELMEMEVVEVSPTPLPAYSGTSAASRWKDDADLIKLRSQREEFHARQQLEAYKDRQRRMHADMLIRGI